MSKTSTAIKISTKLADYARQVSAASDRSLTGQVEHWAKLGSALEPHLTTEVIHKIKTQEGQNPMNDSEVKSEILAVLELFRDESRETLRAELGLDAKPIYEPDPEAPGGFIRIDPDGTRQKGTIEGREFISAS